MSCAGWMFTVVWLIGVVLIESIWVQRLKTRDRMSKAIIRMRQTIFDEANAEAKRIVTEATEYKKRVLRGEDT